MRTGLNVHSEIAPLRTVMLHRPGAELLNLSPDNLAPLLFDDIPFLQEAQAEHDRFARMLEDEGVEVLYLDRLVAEALDARPGAREEFLERWLDESGIEGRSTREAVGGLMRSLGTLELVDKAIEGVRRDEVDLAPSAARSLADLVLAGAGDASPLVVDPIPNVYFTRDTFSVIGNGVSINRMLSDTRRREAIFGSFVFRYHPRFAGVPQWFGPEGDYHLEGGDVLVLGPGVVAVGVSERTQAAAVDALARKLLWGTRRRADGTSADDPSWSGVQKVFAFLIPHKRSFMHLDTVFTQVDVDTFTVHPGILGTLRVFELARGAHEGEVRISCEEDTLDVVLARALGLDSVRLIQCGGDDPIASAREQWNDGSNTLAVRPGRVFVYQRNAITNDILCRAGVELLEVPSAELSRGRGGPHCMSMAFWRDDL